MWISERFATVGRFLRPTIWAVLLACTPLTLLAQNGGPNGHDPVQPSVKDSLIYDDFLRFCDLYLAELRREVIEIQDVNTGRFMGHEFGKNDHQYDFEWEMQPDALIEILQVPDEPVVYRGLLTIRFKKWHKTKRAGEDLVQITFHPGRKHWSIRNVLLNSSNKPPVVWRDVTHETKSFFNRFLSSVYAKMRRNPQFKEL